MRDWTFIDVAKFAFPSKYPSKIVIAAKTIYEARTKLKHYIEIGVRLGWYEHNYRA